MIGDILMWLMPVAWLGIVIFFMVVAWRIMRAHERLATALNKLAQQGDK